MEWNVIIDLLPKTSEEAVNGYWTNGDLILCDTEEKAGFVQEFILALGGLDVPTGYYDTEEDEENGEVDDCTGWYYVG